MIEITASCNPIYAAIAYTAVALWWLAAYYKGYADSFGEWFVCFLLAPITAAFLVPFLLFWFVGFVRQTKFGCTKHG